MAFFEKKKRKPIELNDQYFIFAGRWYERFKDERFEGCRLVEDTSAIPEEYLQSWAGWKPSQPNNSGYHSKYSSNKFF
jgi:hypothetical protein